LNAFQPVAFEPAIIDAWCITSIEHELCIAFRTHDNLQIVRHHASG
jgi:hypothetical protein